MANNTFDEKNYEYIYKYWSDPMKICQYISYDFEILENRRTETCNSPEFKLTNEIDGTWFMQYKPFGSNSPSASSPSSTPSIISNSPFGGMFKGIMKHIPIPNASLTLFIKGNKTVNAKWQWILKTRNPTPFTPRTAEQNKKFEACNSSYGLGGTMSLTTFFENGKAIVQIKGILTWPSELSNNPHYAGLPHHHHHGHHHGNHHPNTVKSGPNKSSSPSSRAIKSLPMTTHGECSDTQLFQKILELEKRITILQRELDQANDENSILKNEVDNLEKAIGKARGDTASDSNSESVIANLKSQNFELQQKNDALEKEIKRMNINRASGYGNAEKFVTLIAENREFKISKSIIQNISEILQNEDTDIIELNCSASTLEIFGSYCKSGTLNFDLLTNKDLGEMLDFVVEYKLNGLKGLIENNLVTNLNYSNLHQYASFAETYNLGELFHACLIMAKDSLKSSTPISKEGLSKEFKTRLMEMMF